jgi:hypothetical protein
LDKSSETCLLSMLCSLIATITAVIGRFGYD